MKNIIFLFLLSIVSCRTPEKPIDRYAHMNKKEKDSLSLQFNDLSDYMLQPSDKHRIFKDSAILLDPTNIDFKAVKSYSYKKRGEHLRAMEILNEAVGLDIKKGSKDQLEYRAWSLLYFYRDYEGTIADVDLINKMSKKSYNVCWGEPCGLLKGQALYKLGRYQDAINTFDTVLIEEVKKGFKAEDNFLVHFYLGRCYHELKEYEKAINDYNMVLNLDKNYTEAHYQLGKIYLTLNQKANAKNHLDIAMLWLKKGKKMGEPYFERFDEVFEYQVSEALSQL